MKKDQITKLSMLVIIATILKDAISFIAAPIFIRLMSQEDYGIVSLFSSWTSIFVHIIGLRTYSSISNAHICYSQNEYKKFLSSNLWISIINGYIIIIVSFLLKKYISKFLLLPESIIPLIFIQSLGAYCLSYYSVKQIQEKKQFFSILLSSLTLIFSTIISIFLIKSMPDKKYYGRILGHTIVYAIVGIGICIFILFQGKSWLNKKYIKFSLNISVPMIIYALSGVLLNQTDRMMIRVMLNSENVAIYNTALLLASVLTIIWQALNNSWQPFYFEYMKNGEINKIKSHIAVFSRTFTLLTLGFIMTCPEIYYLWAGKTYIDGLSILPLAALGFYILFLDGIPCMYLLYERETKIIALGIGIPTIFNILLNYIMLKQFGLIGAIYATIISYGLCYVLHCIFVRKKFGKTSYNLIPQKDILIILSCIILYYIFINIYWIRWLIAIIDAIYFYIHFKKNNGLI